MNLRTLIVAVGVLAWASAVAEDVDPEALYEISTEGSATKLKPGGKGSFVLEIRTKPGAYVSEEAPLKLALTGTGVKVGKDKLTMADSVGKKAEGQKHATPRFEVPLTAAAEGKGTVDGKLTFFICTEKICERQKKTVSVPIEVN